VATPIDQREREELCALFLQLGPDAPTLCEGWTTADLAAHLVLREHFHRWPEARLEAEKAKGFPNVVARLQRGAPLVPWRIPGVRTLVNGLEYFIHHEDVRRANGHGRRTDRPDLDDLSWRMTGFVGRRFAGKVKPIGLELRRPGGESRRLGSGPSSVVLNGEPTELLLYLSGRRGAAEVTLDGAPDAVATVEQVELGL
jgi:uncharacterized protein (TIGR03085 family)